MLQAITEQLAIRQPGQRIMKGALGQLFLGALAIRDVAQIDNHPGHHRIIGQIDRPNTEPPTRTINLHRRQLGLVDHPARQLPSIQHPAGTRNIKRDQQGKGIQTDRHLATTTQHRHQVRGIVPAEVAPDAKAEGGQQAFPEGLFPTGVATRFGASFKIRPPASSTITASDEFSASDM